MTTFRTRVLRFAAASGIVAGVAMMPAHAFAACNNYGGGSCGSATIVPTPSTAVSSQSSNTGSLPFTGGDVVGLSLIGIGALAGGTALVRSGRRKAVSA